MTDFAEVFIDQGQDIRKTIEAFVIEKGWKEVIVVNAIGSVKDLILAAPISNELPLKVGRTPCYGAAEILSFTGEVMVKEKMDPQLRQVYPDASCARAGGLVMGGGLWGGTAFRSLRVFLRPVE